MASGAGLNVVGSQGGVPLLYCTPSSTAVTLPAYGANSANSVNPGLGFIAPGIANPVVGNDSGIQMLAGKGFSKWVFQMLGPGAAAAGYSVTILGTIDPGILASVNMMTQPNTFGSGSDLAGNRTVIPATSWFALPGPSEQSGTGTIANPMVSGTTTVFICALPLVAVRAVLTTIGTPTANMYVAGMAIP